MMEEEIGEYGCKYSPNTIDTFSLEILLSLRDHGLDKAGRQYAKSRWRPSLRQGTQDEHAQAAKRRVGPRVATRGSP